jgi:hypothetical protein
MQRMGRKFSPRYIFYLWMQTNGLSAGTDDSFFESRKMRQNTHFISSGWQRVRRLFIPFYTTRSINLSLPRRPGSVLTNSTFPTAINFLDLNHIEKVHFAVNHTNLDRAKSEKITHQAHVVMPLTFREQALRPARFNGNRLRRPIKRGNTTASRRLFRPI